MDWWAPRVMPTPRSCIPTISTSLAYCNQSRYMHKLHVFLWISIYNTTKWKKHGNGAVILPVCWWGQRHQDLQAPEDQKLPSPSGLPSCAPPPSPEHHSSWGHSLPGYTHRHIAKKIKKYMSTAYAFLSIMQATVLTFNLNTSSLKLDCILQYCVSSYGTLPKDLILSLIFSHLTIVRNFNNM